MSADPVSPDALALAVLAGVPAGVFNVATGSSRVIGAEPTGNPSVRKLSFTGSTEVGKTLMAQCAPTMKAVKTRKDYQALVVEAARIGVNGPVGAYVGQPGAVPLAPSDSSVKARRRTS